MAKLNRSAGNDVSEKRDNKALLLLLHMQRDHVIYIHTHTYSLYNMGPICYLCAIHHTTPTAKNKTAHVVKRYANHTKLPKKLERLLAQS